MNRFLLVSSLVISLFFASSCHEEAVEEVYISGFDKYSNDMISDGIKVDASASEISLVFVHSGGTVAPVCDADWVTLKSSLLYATTTPATKVDIMIAANDAPESRSCELTVVLGDIKKRRTITQASDGEVGL